MSGWKEGKKRKGGESLWESAGGLSYLFVYLGNSSETKTLYR